MSNELNRLKRRRCLHANEKIKLFFKTIFNYFVCLRYPFLKIETDVYPWLHGYGRIWIDELEKGWRKRFGWKLCEELRRYLKEHNIKDYHIDQVKEKYGSLCWYDNYFCEHGTYDLYNDVIKKYETLSDQTCVICGKPSTHTSRGWILPYCDNCHTNGEVSHYDVSYPTNKKGTN